MNLINIKKLTSDFDKLLLETKKVNEKKWYCILYLQK